MGVSRVSGYKYKFSFVMPIYNVEAYLAETVDSILAQTLNFEDNCEIIFVNDGSPDNSEEVCLRYKELYPNNIKYIKQRNQGVSAARNRGIEDAEGKYISFLDSDDKISMETLDQVYDFFEENQSKIDVVSIKLIYFEAMSGGHILNYKYDETRVIDIEKEFDCPQLSGGSTFVKSSAFDSGKRFSTRLHVAEDATLLTEIILEKMAYGVVKDPIYHYRRRHTGNSAISGASMNRKTYLDTPKYALSYMLDYSEKKLGYIPRYVQYLVMYDLQYRFRQQEQYVLNKKELLLYKKMLTQLVRRIDNDIILAQKKLFSEEKLLVLSLKYDEDVWQAAQQVGQDYMYKGQVVYSYSKTQKAHLELMNVNDNILQLEGKIKGQIMPGVEVGFMVNGVFSKVMQVDRSFESKKFLGDTYYQRFCFKINIKLKPNTTVVPAVRLPDGSINKLYIESGSLLRIPYYFKGSTYRVEGNYIICRATINALVLVQNSLLQRFMRESKLILMYMLYGNQSRRNASERINVNNDKVIHKNYLERFIYSVVFIRIAYFIMKPFYRKRIWIISDRLDAAGDNGEALFRYVNEIKDNNIMPVFSILKTSSDYDRMKVYGKVISQSSWIYHMYFLLSDKVISAHADGYVTNPFGVRWPYFIDLLRFKFVFLQHGITHNDLSEWLNRYSKNINLFVTSSDMEYKAIINGQYDYTKEQVKLTGLPRFDLMRTSSRGKIIITPTWRKGLSTDIDPATKQRIYSPLFRNSDYYKFYQAILSDDVLLNYLRQREIQIEFYIHPALATQSSDFMSNDIVKIMKPPFDYSKAFSEGDLLVTDYSSVAFDFAYLKKPVLYTQFDRDTFYNDQVYNRGYFDYEMDGFGDVVYTQEDTIQAILDTVKASYRLSSKYQKRVEDFFAYTDKNNSRRVYDAIKSMDYK